MGKDVLGLSFRVETPSAATCKRTHGIPKAIAKILAATLADHVLRTFPFKTTNMMTNIQVKSTKGILQLGESRF